jgi:hypothetical protein
VAWRLWLERSPIGHAFRSLSRAAHCVHARWVGVETPQAKAEHEGLLRLAADYRGIARAAECTAATMSGLRSLEPAPHDPARWDGPAFLDWMRRKIELQRSFAQLLLEHAEASERILTSAPAGSGER